MYCTLPIHRLGAKETIEIKTLTACRIMSSSLEMTTPANLYPGLNDISDVLEELPLEISRYMTLLKEIDAKCISLIPELNKQICEILSNVKNKEVSLVSINQLFQELMPSLEEKMHVSSISFESLDKLIRRLELSYEVALKNEEIPLKLRLGVDNHPAMHLHHELMEKMESKLNNKSQQALKSESRREAMNAKKQTVNNETVHDTKRKKEDTRSIKKKRKRNNTIMTGKKDEYSQRPKTNESGEPLYCYCNQVAYGGMVGCDGDDCQLEWFHLPCIGLETLPKGKWYCDDCKK